MNRRLMQNRKGQSAAEYMSTYGWAILVISIIGVVIWQLGLFDMNSKLTPTYSGFSVLVPREWAMKDMGNSCVFTVLMANGAGEGLSTISIEGNACTPQNITQGATSVCQRTIQSCAAAGGDYELDAVITYQRASDGQAFQSAGTFWGNVE
jgi:hypothetical protein